MADHAFGGQEERLLVGRVALHDFCHAVRGASALGMNQQLRFRMPVECVFQSCLADLGMHVAATVVKVDQLSVDRLALGDRDRPEELVGQEEDALARVVAGGVIQHLGSVARRADVVAQGLRGRVSVDVRDHDAVRAVLFPALDPSAIDRFDQRTPRLVGHVDLGLVSRDGLGGFPHEPDSAKVDAG